MKTIVALSSLVLFSVACGSSDQTPDPMNPTDPTDPMNPVDPTNPTDPGKNGVRPCEPFESGFAGDDLCILPPDPGTGLHLHVGPEDYDDPDEVEPFLIAEGAENTQYYLLNTTNEEVLLFYRQYYRMRPGSHHLIINVLPEPTQVKGWFNRSELASTGSPIGGTQRSVSDFPPNDVIPEEDKDLARPISPGTGLAMEMHFVNSTTEPLLRETWVNFMQTDSERISILGGLFMIGAGFSIPPGDRQVLNYSAVLDAPERRVVSIFGHRHANTDRFSTWVTRDGVRELVYEDYDWNEPAEFLYNSVIQNPTPDEALARAGGTSGILALKEGDIIEWECEVNNRQDVTLTFKNEAYTGEMCNLFGSIAGGAAFWFDRPELVLK